ncbi:TetR/AcrR family transcriptional regulator [Thermincola ferriacetica]
MSKQPTEIRKKQIIKATLGIIAEKGVSGLTTAEVARRVGFSEAALFRHFPNKLQIIKATMVDVHESLLNGIQTIISKNTGPLNKLEEILKFQLTFIEENKGLPRILFSDELHLGDKELRQTIMKRHEKYLETIMSVIAEGVALGIFRGDLDIKMGAKTFFGLIQTSIFTSFMTDFDVSLLQQFEPIARFLRQCFIGRNYCA